MLSSARSDTISGTYAEDLSPRRRGGGDATLPDRERADPDHPAASEAASLAGAATDAELLRRFCCDRDPAAMAAIVARYERLVMGVALRQVGDRHRAEDVFQATFLVLAQRAATIRRPGSLACWLHGTARRIGLQALAEISRMSSISPAIPEPAVESSVLHQLQASFERQVLDAELAALPEQLRLPLVLHYLEGLTGQEVAERLELSVDAVEGRLKQGRTRLRERLLRHGVGLGVLATAFELSQQLAAAAAPTLVDATAAASLAWVNHQSLEACSANAARLAAQDLAIMSTFKTSLLLSAVACGCLLTGSLGALALGEGTGRGGGAAAPAIQTAALPGTSGNQSSYAGEGPFAASADEPPAGTNEPAQPHLAGSQAGLDRPAMSGTAAGASSYAKLSPARVAVETALDQAVGDFAVLPVPLREALELFADTFQLPLQIDEPRLAELGLDPEVDIPGNVQLSRSATAREALELVLDQAGGGQLDYVVRHGVLTITSREDADARLETVVYELRDLLPHLTAEDVSELIMAGTGGEEWSEQGGPGQLKALPGGILVRNSQRVHREVVQVLEQLRQFAARQDLPAAGRLTGQERVPTSSDFGGGMGGAVETGNSPDTGGFGGGRVMPGSQGGFF